jgi:CPA1 family monovalent cation:H+ antiporter
MSATWRVVADENGNQTSRHCDHLVEIREVTPDSTEGCTDCLREGTRWVHLRECLVCGHVGCCDNSPRKHATAHWHPANHAVMRSAEPGEAWAWCYPDNLYIAER